MVDKQYRMDGHKLYWHMDRVNDWMAESVSRHFTSTRA